MNKTITLSLLFAVIASSNAQTSVDVEKAIKFGKYDVAKIELYKLLKTEPNQGANYYNLGKIHLLQNNADSATFYFKNGLRAAKNAAINNIGLGQLALNSGKEKEARSKFNGAQANIKRDDISTYLLISQACLDANTPDITRATEFANKAIKAKPNNVEAIVMLGDIYLADKSSKLALSKYREALAVNPKSPLALMKIATISTYNKDYATAVQKLNDVVKDYPDFEPAYKELAFTNYLWNKEEKDSNKIANASAAYSKYHKLIGESVDSDNNYADFLIKIKDFDSLDEFSKARWKSRGENFPIYKYAAISAYEKGNNEDAITFINKYFDVVENKESFKGIDYLYLGLAEIAQSKTKDGTFEKSGYENGLANVKKGISIDNSLAEEMNAYALDLFKKGNYEQAYYLFDLGTLNTESPNYVYDTYYKGNCLFLTNEKPMFDNQLQRATEAFNEAIRVSPTTHEALFMNARAYRFIDTDASKVAMEKNYVAFTEAVANKKMFNDPELKDALVESYMFIGVQNMKTDKAKATKAFNKVLELDSNHEYSLNALKKLNKK
ncbi:tetratricopeptide repeat protein [Flavobacterium sp. I3-2]|uniref:tetratricopeptide repeat protein n=1 Tax=Flavobacterium sp. I3-2 TaxID=2748319 RepID=UPI0015AFB85C|nr:tetratricopeptide repeat protein [Flavobacterium sp. I3-2]